MHTEYKINSYNSLRFYSAPETPLFVLALFMRFSRGFAQKVLHNQSNPRTVVCIELRVSHSNSQIYYFLPPDNRSFTPIKCCAPQPQNKTLCSEHLWARVGPSRHSPARSSAGLGRAGMSEAAAGNNPPLFGKEMDPSAQGKPSSV